MNLDSNIKAIFEGLLKSRTKYLTSISTYPFSLTYHINNHEVGLRLTSVDKDTPENEFTKIDTNRRSLLMDYYIVTSGHKYNTFNISIDNKFYYLPEMKRTEFANALDTIEDIVKEYEEDKIIDIISAL